MKLFLVFSIFILFLIVFNLTHKAHSENYYIVTGSIVNIRDGPGTSYAVLDKVKKGTLVMITGLEGEWAKVYYLKDSKEGNSGWIYIRYLASVPSFEEDEIDDLDDDIFSEERVDPSEAQVNLTITDADFKCKESLYGEGFDKCILEIRYSVSSDYEGDLYVSVYCNAYFELDYKDSYLSSRESESESDSMYVYGGYGDGRMEITIRPSTYKTLIRAKVKDLSCSASNVS